MKAAPGEEVTAGRGDRPHRALRRGRPRRAPRRRHQRRHLAARGRRRRLRAPAPTCSTTPGAAGTPSWPRSRPPTAPALVCTHAGGVAPRTRPHRIAYADVMQDVLARTVALAERAVEVGVDPASVVIDPAHDFGKNTWHSLEVTRRLGEMVATGWPVLVSLSNKDFVGESLGRAGGGAADRDAGGDVDQRLAGRPGLPGPQRRRDAATPWTWWPRSGATGRPTGRSAAWPEAAAGSPAALDR